MFVCAAAQAPNAPHSEPRFPLLACLWVCAAVPEAPLPCNTSPFPDSFGSALAHRSSPFSLLFWNYLDVIFWSLPPERQTPEHGRRSNVPIFGFAELLHMYTRWLPTWRQISRRPRFPHSLDPPPAK